MTDKRRLCGSCVKYSQTRLNLEYTSDMFYAEHGYAGFDTFVASDCLLLKKIFRNILFLLEMFPTTSQYRKFVFQPLLFSLSKEEIDILDIPLSYDTIKYRWKFKENWFTSSYYLPGRTTQHHSPHQQNFLQQT